MDFLDPRKKRANSIRLYVGYALMAVVLAIGTIILVYAANGYGIDRKTGDVIQNGLITVDAHPESATIFVNGEGKGTTDNRLILPAGKYTVELQRQNYRSWTHDVNLEGSSIEQLVYPVLFPTNLQTKALHDYAPAPSMASSSLDRHWLVTHQPNTANVFDVLDMSNDQNTITSITLPSDTFTVANGIHTYEAIEWASDNVHLLLKHTFSGGSEFIVLDRENASNSINLNKVFANQPFTSVSLRDKKHDLFYLHNSANGSLFQAASQTRVATLLQTNVLAYKSYQADTVIYATNPAGSPTDAEVRIKHGQDDYLVRKVPLGGAYLLDAADFKGKFYLVAGSTADGRVYVYKDPFSSLDKRPSRTPQPFRVLVAPGAQFLSFSSIDRFVAVQAGSNFVVYDIETNRMFRYDTKLPIAQGQKASWMDGHRLTLISNNTLHVFDFDGTNLQKLSAAHTSYLPFFSPDYLALFTLVPNAEKVSLQRTELKVL